MTMSLNMHYVNRMRADTTGNGTINWLVITDEQENDITIFMPFAVAEAVAKAYTEGMRAIIEAHPITALNEADDGDDEPFLDKEEKKSYLPEFIVVDKYSPADLENSKSFNTVEELFEDLNGPDESDEREVGR